MDIPLKTRLALWWKRPRMNDDPYLYLQKSRLPITNILVLLPKKREQSRIARMFIQSLQNAAGPERRLHIRFVTMRQNLENIDPEITDRLITYSSEHVNRWGLPQQALLDIILPTQPQAVIDLNREFDPVSSIIVQHSRAPLRIGFYTAEKEKYYNILIDAVETDHLGQGYHNIQQLLGLT